MPPEIAAPEKQSFQGAHRFDNYMWLSVFCICMTLLRYYASSKQPSHKITTMQIFATQDKAKPHT